MSKLNANRVHEILRDCLFNDGEDTTNYVPAEGITKKLGFHPGRLEQHTPEIKELLHELPESFMASKGGGMSFLGACMDKNDNHWGEHRDIEELLLLGLATGQAAYVMPRDMWKAMPGGMPYFNVKDTEETKS